MVHRANELEAGRWQAAVSWVVRGDVAFSRAWSADEK